MNKIRYCWFLWTIFAGHVSVQSTAQHCFAQYCYVAAHGYRALSMASIMTANAIKFADISNNSAVLACAEAGTDIDPAG